MRKGDWHTIEIGELNPPRFGVRNHRTGRIVFLYADRVEYAENCAAVLNSMEPPAWGIKLSWRAAWVGIHHSKYNRRTCINIVPFITLWITGTGGVKP